MLRIRKITTFARRFPMKSSRVLVSLSAFFSLSIAACGSSTSPPDDAGGHGAAGDATSTSAGGTATGNGGSSGLGGTGVGGQGNGGSAGGGGTGGAAGAGTGGSAVSGTGGALGGGGGGGGVAGGGGAAGGGGGAGAAGPVAGTTSIFDGMTLNGWQQGTAMYFSVKDGVIDGKGTGTVHGQLLVTQADYGDFRIVVSSNMVAQGGSGHLGICFWGGRTTPPGGYSNCKLIIPPGGTSKGLNTWDYKLNGGLNKTSSTGTPVILSGWNTTEILCWRAKGFCRVGLNGTAALTYQEQNLASIQTGPIGLQIHDGTNEEVQYKDVFVDPAPTVDQLLTVK
jgi:hypothetical protein